MLAANQVANHWDQLSLHVRGFDLPLERHWRVFELACALKVTCFGPGWGLMQEHNGRGFEVFALIPIRG